MNHTDLGDVCTQSIEDLLRRLREHRSDRQSKESPKNDAIERTSSLPPLNVRQPLSGRHSAPMESHLQGRGEGEGFQIHARSKSHGESDYRHSRGGARLMNVSAGEESCNAEADLNLNHHGNKQRAKRADRRCGQRCTCDNKNHLSHGRRKTGRSRSDGHRDSTLVDPSLDDDCPGVPENRIRRSPRYLHQHQHQHQHHVCRHCVAGDISGTCNRARGGAGGVGAGPSRKGLGRRYSPDLEHMSARRFRDNNPSPPSLSPAASGPALVMTLEDVRTAALLSTEFVEYESEEEVNQVGGVHDDSPVKVVSHCSNEEVRGQLQAPVHDVDFSHNVNYRSGRDSPATDMAVACLDLNSSKMLEPLHMSGSMEAILAGEGPANMVRGHPMYLHNHSHHHYHHVIHHHSQP